MSTETSHGDSFSLSGADHPGLQLTNKQFDGDISLVGVDRLRWLLALG